MDLFRSSSLLSSLLIKQIDECHFVQKNQFNAIFFCLFFKDGWTALIAACKEGHHEIAKELLEGGAKVQLPDLVNGE